MRKNNQVADFLTAFNQALGTVNSIAQDYELGKIANAKPEQSQAFTEDQAQALGQAAAANPDGVAYNDATQSYTVTPKADVSAKGDSVPVEPKSFAMQGVTDFLGKRSVGTMSDAQADAARQRAMAGVVMKSDPVQGMRMMRDVTQGERDDQRWDRQTKQWGVEDADRAEKDANKAFDKNMESEVGTWFKSRLTNPDGTARAATVDDHLAASQFKAAKLMEAGKADAAGQAIKDFSSQSLIKIQLETAQRNEALGKTAVALKAGDLGAVKDFYNKFIPDGANVTDIQRGPNGEIIIQRQSADGQPMTPTIMKNTSQLEQALIAFQDPSKLYQFSQDEFKNNLALAAEKRAEEALKLDKKRTDSTLATSGAALKEKNRIDSDRELVRAAGVAFEKARQVGDKAGMDAATLDLIKVGGVNPNSASVAQHSAADLQKARVLVAQKIYPSEGEALDAIISNPDKLYQSYKNAAMKESGNADTAIKTAKNMIADDGWVRSSSGTWKRSGGINAATGAAAAAPLQNVSPADISATAKKYGVSEDEVKKRLNIK